MNVVFLGVSTSQTLLLVITALSLLILTALLWKNHRTPPAARPVVVFAKAWFQCPTDLVSWQSQTHSVQAPARAPPTFHSSLSHIPAKGLDPTGRVAMVRHVADLLTDFR